MALEGKSADGGDLTLRGNRQEREERVRLGVRSEQDSPTPDVVTIFLIIRTGWAERIVIRPLDADRTAIGGCRRRALAIREILSNVGKR